MVKLYQNFKKILVQILECHMTFSHENLKHEFWLRSMIFILLNFSARLDLSLASSMA